MMDKPDPMRKILAQRRGQGIDINIILADKDDENKNTDLAPKPAQPMMADGKMQDPMATPEMPGQGDVNIDTDMLEGMTDHDKQDLEARKPRSLGERARQAALGRMKK